MSSLFSKDSFNFILSVVVICVAQLPVLAEGHSEFEGEIMSTQNKIEPEDTTSLVHHKKIVDLLVKNFVGELYDMPWASNNVVNILPRFRKRNLEHLAKSSGGYLKIFQNDSNDKDETEDVDQIAKLLGDLVGKQKRGVYTLAKNHDFPHKKYKPTMKEVYVGPYKYMQRSLDIYI